jgi:hypothetical protein
LVISSWPLGYQKGRISVAVDSSPRRVAQDLPLTITTPRRSVILGGSDDPVEMHDLVADPAEQTDISHAEREATALLVEAAITELREEGATPELLAPRHGALMSSERAETSCNHDPHTRCGSRTKLSPRCRLPDCSE